MGFATKQVLAQDMIERALEAGVPFGWVTADESYGQDMKFRLWLKFVDVARVVSVPKNAMVVSMDLRKVRVNHLLSDTAWKRLSAGDGVKGRRRRTGGARYPPLRRREWGHWRSVASPSDIAYYVCFGPADATPERLVGVAGAVGDRGVLPDREKRDRPGPLSHQIRGYQVWYLPSHCP